MSAPAADVVERAERFVRGEAGFAQVTTLDRHGYPVARSMTAFLGQAWVVELVQRGSHARLVQLRRDPRMLVTWVAPAAPDASPGYPHVFDLGQRPQRAVMIRGTARFLDPARTWATYSAHSGRLRALGHRQAPVRDAADVAAQLTGLQVIPYRVRLEGFGDGAQSFDWSVGEPTAPTTTEGDR